MKKTIQLLLLAFACHASLSTHAQERVLTDTEKILGLSRLWEGVRSNYVYYDQLTFDWDSLYEASIPEFLAIDDTYTYCRELQRLIATVKDGHTHVYHKANLPHEERTTPAPFTTRYIESKVYVDKVQCSELAKKGVKKGTEVIAVNNQGVITYATEELGKYISTSTPQWLFHEVFEQYELTKGKRTDPLTVEFKNGKKQFSIPFDRNQDWDIPEEVEEKFTMKYTQLDHQIGLLKINHFMDESFNQKFDSIYPDLLTSKALIIDLRNNSGGNSGYADYILRHLSEEPMKSSFWSSRMYIPAHASWGYPPEWYAMGAYDMPPVSGKTIYNKPVLVLVNAGTYSSAEDFCIKFQGAKRGSIMGVPTGGSTGNPIGVTLIKDLAFASICSKKDTGADGTVYVGVGIIPDLSADETLQSFLTGEDAVLKKAINHLLKTK